MILEENFSATLILYSSEKSPPIIPALIVILIGGLYCFYGKICSLKCQVFCCIPLQRCFGVKKMQVFCLAFQIGIIFAIGLSSALMENVPPQAVLYVPLTGAILGCIAAAYLKDLVVILTAFLGAIYISLGIILIPAKSLR